MPPAISDGSPTAALIPLGKRDKGVNIVRALIGIHGLKVHGMAQHMIVLGNAVTAVNISGFAGNRQRFAAIITLHEGNRFGTIGPLIQRAAKRERALEA